MLDDGWTNEACMTVLFMESIMALGCQQMDPSLLRPRYHKARLTEGLMKRSTLKYTRALHASYTAHFKSDLGGH